MYTHLDLAGATQSGCSSGNVPLPIGVGKNGNLQFSTNAFSSFSHCEYAAPIERKKFSILHLVEIQIVSRIISVTCIIWSFKQHIVYIVQNIYQYFHPQTIDI